MLAALLVGGSVVLLKRAVRGIEVPEGDFKTLQFNLGIEERNLISVLYMPHFLITLKRSY